MRATTFRTLSVTLASALAAVMLPGCTTVEPAPAPAGAKSAEASSVLRGSVLYRERDALPDGAQVRVQLIDGTPSETAPKVYAETTYPSQGRQVPIPFALPFDPSKLDPGHLYALRGYILIDGKIAYVTRARVNVDPKAVPASVSILLTPGSADPVVLDSPAPPGAIKPPAPTRRSGPRGAQPPGNAR